jgi:hypothetical protein
MAKKKKLYIPHGNITLMVANEGYSRSSIKNAQNYTSNSPRQREIRRVAKAKYGASDILVIEPQ